MLQDGVPRNSEHRAHIAARTPRDVTLPLFAQLMFHPIPLKTLMLSRHSFRSKHFEDVVFGFVLPLGEKRNWLVRRAAVDYDCIAQAHCAHYLPSLQFPSNLSLRSTRPPLVYRGTLEFSNYPIYPTGSPLTKSSHSIVSRAKSLLSLMTMTFTCLLTSRGCALRFSRTMRRLSSLVHGLATTCLRMRSNYTTAGSCRV